jgi:hypothetical protein
MSTILELASPQCSAEEFDGEIVALNLETGMYYSMSGLAGRIFNDLANGHSAETLLELAARGSTIQKDVDVFIRALQDAGLMRSRIMPGAPTAPLTVSAELLGASASPVLESFGDMQSLLLLDPVHEVDELVGWPKAPDGEN